MKSSLSSIVNSRKKIVLLHVSMWVVMALCMMIAYGYNLPSPYLSIMLVIMFMPIFMLHYYSVANFGIPRYLHRKQYLKFGIFLLVASLLAVTAFRLMEILGSDPIILRAMQKAKPGARWSKLDGDFWQQFTDPRYIISAVEQTSVFVWLAISAKFFKMWYDKNQAATEAELSFLKGQLHPHFLFNTLNNLYALTLNQSPRSPSVVMRLSEILRYMLYEANREVVTLTRDMEILEGYIELETIRYEDRLDINMNMSGVKEDMQIAPLLILPLVENAFKHGVSEQVGQAWINIDLTVREQLLTFKISNSKPEEKPHDDREPDHVNIGLANVRKRLELLYPSASSLKIMEEDDIFAAIVRIQLDKRIDI